MRKIKEVLRLHYEAGLSQANIAKVNRISRCAVQQYIMRFTAAGLNWPLPEDISDIILENKLFPGKRDKSHRPALDYDYLLKEIHRPDATLSVLWEEYKQQNTEGYQYSYFCDLFNAYRVTLNYSRSSGSSKNQKWASRMSIYAGNTGYQSRRFITGRASTAAWK